MKNLSWIAGAALLAAGCAGAPSKQAAAGAPVLLAHRGVHQQFDKRGLTNTTCTAERMLPPTHGHLENTLASMRAAFEAGADMIELDIHPTADGDFVVFHDWTVDCRTEGRGVTRQQALAYLKSLDIGHGYTADGGRTFPLRGKFRGAMPTWAEVMAAFPGRRFLVNVKSNSAGEGAAIAAFVKARGYDVRLLAFSGGERPMAVLREAFPGTPVLSRERLKSCFLGYLAFGWVGHVPAACHYTLVYTPSNYTWFLAGWPHRFVERMAAVGSEVYLLGPMEEGRARGIEQDDPIPEGYRGGIYTDRIEVVGPKVRRTAR
jgi:glycerophosphoryl diester phosphodiesterase